MQITGQNHVAADKATAWAAFHDAGVLQRTLPGAQSVEEVGPGTYALVVTAGVASIKGTYEGRAEFKDESEPDAFTLELNGAGGPGTVQAQVRVELSDADGGGTQLDWVADAVVGGPVGGVGQRMIASVAKRLAAQFFSNIDEDIRTGGDAAGGESASADDASSATEAVAAGGSRGTSVKPVGGPAVSGDRSQLIGFVVGATVALAGVALGARLRGH